MDLNKQKRVTVKVKCPNPLFEQWLTEWRDQAMEKELKMQYSFNNALKSLRKYPLPFETGRECKILKGFGDKLCKMLDDKLKEYKVNKNNEVNNLPVKNNKIPATKKQINKRELTGSTSKGNPNKVKSPKKYIPQHGSGGYAILVTLYKQSLQHDYAGFLRKADIIRLGKDLINCSFTKPEPGSRYTAWSSMKTLLTKNLVSKISNPAKFSLTAEGLVLARKLYENSTKDNENDDCGLISKNMEFDNNHCIDSEAEKLDTQMFNCPEELISELLNEPCSVEDDTFSVNHEQLKNQNYEYKKPLIKPKITLERFASSPSVTYENQDNQKSKKSLKKFASTNNISIAQNSGTLKKSTSSNSVASSKSSVSVFEHFIIHPYSFDIILYVDTNETSGASNSECDDVLVELKKFGVKHEVKNLKVGDFTWICRDRSSNKELILPYIIERKRMDDFASSIKDKRYYEQKFRLKKSGIENLTYLVESHGRNQHLGLPLSNLFQAASNTAIQENFSIKFTENIRETIEYLANFSKILIDMFKAKTLASCTKETLLPVDINNDTINLMTFNEFNASSVKNKRMMVTDLFVKMLIQLKGMSVERALAVTQKYPTPALLKKAYESNSENVNEKLLSTIKYGAYSKSIGAVLSKTVYQSFCKMQY